MGKGRVSLGEKEAPSSELLHNPALIESITPRCDDEELNIMVDGSTKSSELCDKTMIVEDGKQYHEYLMSNITHPSDTNTIEENVGDRYVGMSVSVLVDNNGDNRWSQQE